MKSKVMQTNDMKNFYSCRKEIYGPSSAGSSPLLCADGTKLISEKNKTLERWAKQFDGALNRPSSTNDKAIERLLQVPLVVTPPLGEVQIAIRQLSSGKAPRFDSIPAEICKEGESALTGKLVTLIKLTWGGGTTTAGLQRFLHYPDLQMEREPTGMR